MTEIDVVERPDTELVDDSAQFFAPVDHDVIDSLLGQYDATRKRINVVGEFMADELSQGSAIHYFLDGNKTEDRGRHSMTLSAEQLFCVSGAVGALNSAYWSKALQLTDVLDTMPQKRRDEWNEQIQNPMGTKRDKHAKDYVIQPLPDFTEDTVRITLGDLLRMRSQFFGERVDGIFRGLSGEHVTNAPEAFGKRMIIARVLTHYDTSDHSTCGLINDLRCVIAKFMGRDEPKYYASNSLIESLKSNWGQWVMVDGGALKIRLYKKGTAHMEVHPDLAWRLNQVLASLHPRAIPAQFRQKPKKRVKDHVMMGRPLPFRVLEILAGARQAVRRHPKVWPERYDRIQNSAQLTGYSIDEPKISIAEAEGILQAIGGTKSPEGWFEFNYSPLAVINEIVVSGCIPDRVAHQYYPTPEKLARIAVEWADIGPDDECAEPQAGQGGIADYMPKDRTTCIEISPLHCAVLRAKGFKTIETDFILWADLKPFTPEFDCIVMNPPFSEGRAKLHTEYAATKIKPGGRLVAILPASMRNKALLGTGWSVEWSPIYEREFAGTGAAVTMLKATRIPT
ncbi:DUF4942 domain-containing protein [Rhodoferax ferrireducens]|uniref:DUF4942 domain-containing protein n=1 Tax=Rhodoferax ferrireducens TaxID=192843 RepID=UPI000E0D97D6|nr:DUF4942 domain-containing protein [Rhodoferax ferrireducens]